MSKTIAETPSNPQQSDIEMEFSSTGNGRGDGAIAGAAATVIGLIGATGSGIVLNG